MTPLSFFLTAYAGLIGHIILHHHCQKILNHQSWWGLLCIAVTWLTSGRGQRYDFESLSPLRIYSLRLIFFYDLSYKNCNCAYKRHEFNVYLYSLISFNCSKQHLNRLSILDLSDSRKLIQISDLSGSPNLERLILCHCVRLVEVHPSVGALKKLTILDVEGCE